MSEFCEFIKMGTALGMGFYIGLKLMERFIELVTEGFEWMIEFLKEKNNESEDEKWN